MSDSHVFDIPFGELTEVLDCAELGRRVLVLADRAAEIEARIFDAVPPCFTPEGVPQ